MTMKKIPSTPKWLRITKASLMLFMAVGLIGISFAVITNKIDVQTAVGTAISFLTVPTAIIGVIREIFKLGKDE